MLEIGKYGLCEAPCLWVSRKVLLPAARLDTFLASRIENRTSRAARKPIDGKDFRRIGTWR